MGATFEPDNEGPTAEQAAEYQKQQQEESSKPNIPTQQDVYCTNATPDLKQLGAGKEYGGVHRDTCKQGS